MARTLTWNGSTSDAWNDAANWTPNFAPEFGDALIVTFGTIDVLPPDQPLSDNLIEVGSTTGPAATLVFDNTGATGIDNPTITGTTITNAVTLQTTPEQTVIDANGTFVNQGTIIADGPSGSIFTINVGQNGANPGFFINQGTIEADAGNTMDIVVGPTSEVLNAGIILANGGSVLFTTTGSNQIVGGYAPMVALAVIQNGGTFEFNAGLPYDPTLPVTTSGVRQFFLFTDAAGDLLKIDQITQFSGNVLGFQAGDTIDIGVLPTITSYTYDKNNILTLSDASGVVASIDIAGNFNTGTFTATNGFSGSSFDLSTSGGDTTITTVAVNDVWTATSGTNLWTTGANWSGGNPPGGGGVGVIGDGTPLTYTVNTGSGSVAVGTLILNNPDATLEVAGTLDVTPATYASTLQQVAGTIQVDTGGSLDIDALRQFQADTVLDLETGSTLTAAGRPSTQFTSDGTIALSSGGNRFALSLQGTTTIDDATVDAGPGQPSSAEGGSILIGQDGAGTPASVLAEDGATVTDTYAILFSSPTSYGTLTITGPTTVWTDAGDPSDTEQTRGYMLIGDNEQSNNTPTPPYLASASLLVTDGATLNEAAYSNIGSSIDSSGSVDISGATWNIGNTGTTGTPLGFLQVGRYGIGSLTIDSGSTVSVGAGGTIVNDGTTETINYAVEIGHYASASGTLTLEGTGSQLDTLNALLDGESGTGVFTVETDASASIDGNIDLGGNSQGSEGGSGQLFVDTGGRIEQGQSTVLALWSGSTVSVDSTSAIDVGDSGTFIDGSIHVDSGSGLRGDGSVEASVDNDGAIHATNNGTYDLSTGGLLDIIGNVTGSGASHVSPGATLEIDGTIAASQFITFDSGPGGTAGLPETLILTTPGTGLSNSVTNLQDFDKIELGGLTITGVTYSAGTVTVTTTGLDYLLTDVAFQSGASHNFTYGHDGTTNNDYIQVTCFAAGTRIATPRGDVAVESLCIGEPVLTVVGGRPQPIAWIGRRRIDCRRHPRPASVWPVRIRQAAFGPGLPARDLFVSPDHALFIDGVLIPAKYLLNGTSIAQVPLDTITYYHIELPRHDVVLAEGLPAESYLDTDDRATFDNGGRVMRLHPDLSSLLWEAKGCAPLVITGPALAAAHARLGEFPQAA